MINKSDFRWLVSTVIKDFGLYSPAAVNLLLGTAAVESRFGTDLRQVGGGPALGVFQMEPETEADIWDNFLSYRPALVQKVYYLSGVDCPNNMQLAVNLIYSTVMARLHYYRKVEPLPSFDDINGLAAYWKRYYNTFSGKGTEDKFIRAYNRYVIM